MIDWLIGVFLAVAASFCAAFGDNLVKYAFRKIEERKMEEEEEVVPIYKNPIWLFGIFNMIVLNTSLNLASFAFADASLLISLGGLHIILNLPLSYYMNEEHSSRRAIGCNLLIMFGVMVVLLTGNHDSHFFTVHELKANFYNPAFIFASIVIGVTIFVFSGVLKARDATKFRKKIALTTITGLVGSITQVFAKSMSECLKDNAWTSLFTWMLILLTVVSALSQVYLLNQCLNRYSANFCVPIVNSIMIVCGSLYAAIFFHEISRWSVMSTLCVPVGIVITAFGIAMLAREPENVEDFIEEEEAEELGSHSGEDSYIRLDPVDELV